MHVILRPDFQTKLILQLAFQTKLILRLAWNAKFILLFRACYFETSFAYLLDISVLYSIGKRYSKSMLSMSVPDQQQ